MPGRHIEPRHKAPRNRYRTFGRALGDLSRILPSTGASAAAAVVGVAGLAGVLTASGLQTAGASAGLPADGIQAAGPLPVAEKVVDVGGRDGRDTTQVSRSSSRPPLAAAQRATKSEALPVSRQVMRGNVTATVQPADPREIAQAMLADYGWSSDEFGCLDELYMHESGWDPAASNPSSGAYGIPQSLPGDKMATAGADWATNPETQLKWGLGYIESSYGTPCGAWDFWQSNSWY